MIIKNGFVLREVAGKAIVIAVGEASKTFHGMINLNGTGKDIWQGVADGKSAEQIAQKLMEDYEVDYAITHTCPLYQVRTLGCYHVAREEEPLQNYFQWVCDKLNQTNEMLADGSGDKKGRSFKHWYFVHWHTDWNKNWLELMHLEELPQKCRAIYLDVEDMETGEHIFLK